MVTGHLLWVLDPPLDLDLCLGLEVDLDSRVDLVLTTQNYRKTNKNMCSCLQTGKDGLKIMIDPNYIKQFVPC